MENTNPFVEINNTIDSDIITVPRFKKTVQVLIRFSPEAFERLQHLAEQYTGSKTKSAIGDLLEQIGLYALNIEIPKSMTDTESGVTTEDCRHSGYIDGLQGNPDYFLAMFSNKLTSEFHMAYMRGYFEGNAIRTS